MIRHNSLCAGCGGRGHIWVPPESRGWHTTEKPRQWFAKGGGVHTFMPGEPETLMIPCECALPRESTAP